MDSPAAVYSALLLSGLAGSLGHCLGMCGPLITMASVRFARGKGNLLPHLLYHGARVAVYTLFGAVAGGIGSLLAWGERLSRLTGSLSILLGAGVVLFGLGYLGCLPLARMEGAGAWAGHAMRWSFQRQGLPAVALLGALNALLPCCLVYSALLVAASTRGCAAGAWGMACFGSGTFPALLLVGVGAGKLGVSTRRHLLRIAGGLMLLTGLQLILRGLAAHGALPAARLGGVVLW